MKRIFAALAGLLFATAVQGQALFLANDGTFKAPISGGVTITGTAAAGSVPIATSATAAAWTPLFSAVNAWTAQQNFRVGLTSGLNGGTGGFITLNGATSGSATLSASATGNATVNTSFTATGGIATNTTFTAGLNGGASGQVVLNGATSGAVTQVPQSVAGTPTITWGTATGTPAVTASGPLAIAAATGNITCATCATTANGGALSGVAPVALSAGGVVSITGAAGQVLAGSGPAFTAAPTLGVNGGTGGQLTLAGSTSGSRALAVNSTGSTFTFGGGALAVAEGGTGDTGTAWATFTPSPSCTGATFTVNTARSKTLGKTTWIEGDFTSSGTCTTALVFNLPNNAQANAILPLREISVSGFSGACLTQTGTVTCSKFDGTNAWTANDRFVVAGVYENQ